MQMGCVKKGRQRRLRCVWIALGFWIGEALVITCVRGGRKVADGGRCGTSLIRRFGDDRGNQGIVEGMRHWHWTSLIRWTVPSLSTVGVPRPSSGVHTLLSRVQHRRRARYHRRQPNFRALQVSEINLRCALACDLQPDTVSSPECDPGE